jgi:hypothetical protein
MPEDARFLKNRLNDTGKLAARSAAHRQLTLVDVC